MGLSYEMLYGCAIVIGLVAVNGFFVASEFALVSIRRTRVEELISQGGDAAKAVQQAVNDLGPYIAGTQIGITLASLGLGWLGEPAVASLLARFFAIFALSLAPSLLHTTAYTLSFLFITFVHVVFGELVPKAMALQKPEAVALSIGRPMALIVFLFRPMISLLHGAGNLTLRLMGFRPAGRYNHIHSVDELDFIVRQSHEAGVLDDLEREIVERTFHFAELSAGEVCTPRGDIDALDLEKPVPELLRQLAETMHTRLPVYEGEIDNIVGIIHMHDVYREMQAGHEIADLRPLIRPAFVVPESIHLDHLVEQFREHQTKLALVVDEHGATAGLVTFKDIIEEVFGQLHGSSTVEEPAIQEDADGRYIVRGDVRLDEITREIGWNLEDEDVATIAGLVMKRLGRVAQAGDTVETGEGTIKVVHMTHLRITQVVLERKKQQEPLPE